MKKIIFILSMIFLTLSLSAQDKYAENMNKAFDLWEEDEIMKAYALFDRISKVEKDKWLPSYYAANTLIVKTFDTDSIKLVSELLKIAEKHIENAKQISPANSEILTLEGLLYTAYVASDPATYGMIYSGKIIGLHKKALSYDNENPRAHMNLIEYEMNSAKFFGKDVKEYCERMKKVIPLFKEENSEDDFAPRYGIERAKNIVKDCI